MIIYVDGACSGNGSDDAIGGFGVIILDDNEKFIAEHHEQVKNTTNNRMELSAILWTMIKYGKELPCPTVYSDSAYCVNALTSWCWSWRNRGWLKSDNKEPENLDLIQAYCKLYDMGYHIDLRKCAGHAGNFWNEQADKLAVAAKEGAQQVAIKLLKHIDYNERK